MTFYFPNLLKITSHSAETFIYFNFLLYYFLLRLNVLLSLVNFCSYSVLYYLQSNFSRCFSVQFLTVFHLYCLLALSLWVPKYNICIFLVWGLIFTCSSKFCLRCVFFNIKHSNLATINCICDTERLKYLYLIFQEHDVPVIINTVLSMTWNDFVISSKWKKTLFGDSWSHRNCCMVIIILLRFFQVLWHRR